MLKVTRILLLTVLISLFFASSALAEEVPLGDCPRGFALHLAHEHDEHHGDHIMVGTNADQNGDGYICANHVTPTKQVHVHIDNNVMRGVYNR